MKRKCDLCDRPATTHAVEIVKGKKIERHLCDIHAAQAGLLIKAVPEPVSELLSSFIKSHSGVSEQPELVCENCGLSYTEFREQSLLGCPQCYQAFESQLAPLLERVHEGATHHIGKVPKRAGADEQRQQLLLRMRKQLADAVAAEDYEEAARLRDKIREMESSR